MTLADSTQLLAEVARQAHSAFYAALGEDSPDHITVVQTLTTARSARTMTRDPTTHKLYLSAADYEAPSAADSAGPRRRPPMVPGSFRVLVYGLEGQ